MLQEFDTAGAHGVEVFREARRIYIMFAVNLADQASLLYMSPDLDTTEAHFPESLHLC